MASLDSLQPRPSYKRRQTKKDSLVRTNSALINNEYQTHCLTGNEKGAGNRSYPKMKLQLASCQSQLQVLPRNHFENKIATTTNFMRLSLENNLKSYRNSGPSTNKKIKISSAKFKKDLQSGNFHPVYHGSANSN